MLAIFCYTPQTLPAKIIMHANVSSYHWWDNTSMPKSAYMYTCDMLIAAWQAKNCLKWTPMILIIQCLPCLFTSAVEHMTEYNFIESCKNPLRFSQENLWESLDSPPFNLCIDWKSWLQFSHACFRWILVRNRFSESCLNLTLHELFEAVKCVQLNDLSFVRPCLISYTEQGLIAR